MPRRIPRPRLSTTLLTLLALALGTGWAWRESVHASERAALVPSQTINLDQVDMSVFKDQDKPVGKIGLYLQGETEASGNLVTGRFTIDPGKSPHTPHVHPDEEIMVIETGHGEIVVDGKTTKIGPGSVMYTGPNASHGIVNTGTEPLTFYFVKWLPKAAK
jgi:mannose-6-phosphate isomerase-like protein (cupin superfamily)